MRNTKRSGTIAGPLCAVPLLWLLWGVNAIAQSITSSPISVSPSGSLLAVVNADSNSVTLVALPELSVLAEVPVGREPQTLAFSVEGARLYVANGADNSVTVLDVAGKTLIAEVPVGTAPFGVVSAPDGRWFVTNSGLDSVEVYTPDTLELLTRMQVGPRPRGLALAPDGRLLYVTHFLSGELSIIDTQSMGLRGVISTSPDANLSQSIALTANGQRAFLPQTRSNSSNPALVFDATVFPVVAQVELAAMVAPRRTTISLEIADRPVGLPLAAALLEARNQLWVANAASNDVSVIDLTSRRSVAHIEVDDNPRGLAISPDGLRAFVSNALSGTVSVVDTLTYTVTDTLLVTEIPLPPGVLEGKRLFNSANSPALARDQWIACASCHFDGGMDGRTWMFRDGPRNTPSLFGVAETLPMHWSGDLDELQDVEHTIRVVQAGRGLVAGADNCTPACNLGPPNAGRDNALDNLATYLATLQATPNPNSQVSASVQRGRHLFMSADAGCAQCHVPPTFTDGLRHDVGTGGGPLEAKGRAFDTPSLRGIHATAPYFHDGSAASLRELLTQESSHGAHGYTEGLSAIDVDDLVEFLQSI